jgi:outer membrane cobalamin receptor
MICSLLKKLHGSAILVFVATFSFSQATIDTVHIQEITVKGDRVFKKDEAGMKTTEVDSMVLIDKIMVSLSDVLSENTPVFIKDHGRGALATVSFRGTAPSHTQVLWNGISINSPMLGMTDFSLIPAFIIDDLTLNHGSASMSSLSGGLGGSIVIGNSPSWDNKLGWKYIQGIGSFSTFDEFMQFGIGNKKVQWKTRLYHSSSDNNYEYVNKAILERPIVKNENAAYLRKGATQELYFRPTNDQVLSIKAWGQIASRSLPTVMSYEGDEMSNNNNQQDTTVKVSADWTHYGENSKIILRSGIDIQQTAYTLMNRVGGVGMVPAISSFSEAFSWYNHFGFEFSFSDQLSSKVGLDYHYFDVNSREEIRATGYSKTRSDVSLMGGFFWEPFRFLNVSVVLRDEMIEENVSPLMFNVGISYRSSQKSDFILKANISRNFRHPSLNDLYWQPGGNPNLLPEKSNAIEFSLEHYLQQDRFYLTHGLTPYYSEIDDWIIWLPSFQGFWQPFNLKMVKSYGLEYYVKGSRQFGDFQFLFNGNYALTRSVNYGDRLFLGDNSYGKQLPFIPVHSGNILLSMVYKQYYVRFQNNSYSERFTLTSNEVGSSDDSEDIGVGIPTSRMNWYYPYFMNNLSFGGDFVVGKIGFGIGFKINNLFNEEYRSVLGRYMPGRNYELSLKIYGKHN